MRQFIRRGTGARAFAHAPAPAPDVPWRAAEWCAVDLELTGLHSSDEIIAVGAVPIRDGAVMLGEALYTLAHPARPPSQTSILVHKLRLADLWDAPALDEALDLLLARLAGRLPVFHTAAVERSFLGRELRRRRLRLPPSADTEVLGRLWLRLGALDRAGPGGPGGPARPGGLSLPRLAAALGQRAEDPHHALGDALTTAKSFIALASHLDAAAGPQTVGSLTQAETALQSLLRRDALQA